VLDEVGLAGLLERFHQAHERRFGYAYAGEQPVEVVNLRLQAVGIVHRPRLVPARDEDGAGSLVPVEERPVYFDGVGYVETPVYRRAGLTAGSAIDGPAVVEEFGSTTVLFPEWSSRVDEYANLVMTRSR
jgi:N-methylhydantoinase A